MATLVYLHTTETLGKGSLELVTYARKIDQDVTVLVTGDAPNEALETLGTYGAKEVLVNRALSVSNNQEVCAWLAQQSTGFNTLVFSHDFNGRSIAPRLSVRLKAGLISGAVSLPEANGSIKVNVFSGKAFGYVACLSETRIISLLPNSIAPEAFGGTCSIREINEKPETKGSITVLEVKKPEGAIPLPEAELVVSAGRGLKGPENWGMVEDLAHALGAATACSRPVADIGWRPHHEHVGQTGVAIRPNLYIAIGISGAIQHLAGVNGSKVIVVINTDAEAPFFKAADYGIIGDAFEVIPKLTEAVKKFKAQA
ncbi:MAG: electron transfer flavoprotein subunit alpha/FixB family protein [Flavobacteriales bacterium]